MGRLMQASKVAAWLVLGCLATAPFAGAFEFDESKFEKDQDELGQPPADLIPKKSTSILPPKNAMPFCENDQIKYNYYDYRTSETACLTPSEAFRRYIPANSYKTACCKLKTAIPSAEPTVTPDGKPVPMTPGQPQ